MSNGASLIPFGSDTPKLASALFGALLNSFCCWFIICGMSGGLHRENAAGFLWLPCAPEDGCNAGRERLKRRPRPPQGPALSAGKNSNRPRRRGRRAFHAGRPEDNRRNREFLFGKCGIPGKPGRIEREDQQVEHPEASPLPVPLVVFPGLRPADLLAEIAFPAALWEALNRLQKPEALRGAECLNRLGRGIKPDPHHPARLEQEREQNDGRKNPVRGALQ